MATQKRTSAEGLGKLNSYVLIRYGVSHCHRDTPSFLKFFSLIFDEPIQYRSSPIHSIDDNEVCIDDNEVCIDDNVFYFRTLVFYLYFHCIGQDVLKD